MAEVPEPAGPFSHHTAARHGELRIPAIIAVAAAGALHAALPSALLIEPRWFLPALEVVLLGVLLTINPRRLASETRLSRAVGLALAALILITNLIAMGYLLHELVSSTAHDARDLLLAAVQVWITNMVAFGLVYWELDRGGPVARLSTSNAPTRRADFLFPQDDGHNPDLGIDPKWIPVFVDYLYLSITNSVAFSPTDTLPLTTRAKGLMAVQALAAMITSLLVVARAVNILG